MQVEQQSTAWFSSDQGYNYSCNSVIVAGSSYIMGCHCQLVFHGLWFSNLHRYHWILSRWFCSGRSFSQPRAAGPPECIQAFLQAGALPSLSLWKFYQPTVRGTRKIPQMAFSCRIFPHYRLTHWLLFTYSKQTLLKPPLQAHQDQNHRRPFFCSPRKLGIWSLWSIFWIICGCQFNYLWKLSVMDCTKVLHHEKLASGT